MPRRPLTETEQNFKDEVVNTIRGAVFAARDAGGLEIIKEWETETIFTTAGLDSIFSPNSENESEWYHTKHNIVYNITIGIKNRMPDKVTFTAKFTELSLEEQNIGRRNEILSACGKALSAHKYPCINLVESLPVTNDDAFLNKLKNRVEYYLNIGIPAFERGF